MRTCEGSRSGRCVLTLALFLAMVSGPASAQDRAPDQAQPQAQGLAPDLAQAEGPDQAPRHVRGRLLVKFREGVNTDTARGVVAALQAREEDELPGTGVKVLSLPENASETAFEHAFRNREEVEFAEVDRIVPPDGLTPNDPLYLSQWHLQRIAGPDAWAVTSGSAGIIIAILDTGVDGTHPDLAAKMVPGWNIYEGNSDTRDVYGHGTKVAGTAAAFGDNATGVASVCWDCLIMPVRISAANGYASLSDIARGLTWAADHGARVANISYMVTTSSTVTTAAKYFHSHGGVVASSAGNYSTFDASADNPYILTVSGTDENDALYSWTNTGNNVDLAAPGCVGNTTTNGGGYAGACGTSFSAPIVAGVAALVLSKDPSLTPAMVTDILRQSGDDLGPAGWDAASGYGRVNAGKAVESAPGVADTEQPSVAITAPSNGVTITGQVSVQVTATDNVGVASVSLTVNGAPYGTAYNSPYSFAWDTTTASDGSYTLEARASDAAGNVSTASYSVTVSNAVDPVKDGGTDTTPPEIAITTLVSSPGKSGNVSVNCSAIDNVQVVKVELYVDGVLNNTSTTAPFTVNWNTKKAKPGTHLLVEKAYDAAGNVGSSDPVAVER